MPSAKLIGPNSPYIRVLKMELCVQYRWYIRSTKHERTTDSVVISQLEMAKDSPCRTFNNPPFPLSFLLYLVTMSKLATSFICCVGAVHFYQDKPDRSSSKSEAEHVGSCCLAICTSSMRRSPSTCGGLGRRDARFSQSNLLLA